MAEQIDPKQQHLDEHYGDLGLTLVDEPEAGAGLSADEADSFLTRLRPRRRATLGDSLKKKG